MLSNRLARSSRPIPPQAGLAESIIQVIRWCGLAVAMAASTAPAQAHTGGRHTFAAATAPDHDHLAEVADSYYSSEAVKGRSYGWTHAAIDELTAAYPHLNAVLEDEELYDSLFRTLQPIVLERVMQSVEQEKPAFMALIAANFSDEETRILEIVFRQDVFQQVLSLGFAYNPHARLMKKSKVTNLTPAQAWEKDFREGYSAASNDLNSFTLIDLIALEKGEQSGPPLQKFYRLIPQIGEFAAPIATRRLDPQVRRALMTAVEPILADHPPPRD